jgi:hypothetical protein
VQSTQQAALLKKAHNISKRTEHNGMRASARSEANRLKALKNKMFTQQKEYLVRLKIFMDLTQEDALKI